MDKQVQLAMAKWPNVPHCYGWLGLDARGAWRMRDQRAQELGLPGSKIGNPTLRGFIDRNYLADEIGRYYFQNGPQRVYIELESTPFIVHFDPQTGWVTHNGLVLEACDGAWMTGEGKLILRSAGILAQIDDRDMARVLQQLHWRHAPVDDERLLAWLAQPDDSLAWVFDTLSVPIGFAALAALAQAHPFVASPYQMHLQAQSITPTQDNGAIPNPSQPG